MRVANDIEFHLPSLRRHARALCGSQSSGDAYVRAILEALIAGSASIDLKPNPKIGLYRAFHALWSTSQVTDKGSQSSNEFVRLADERLSHLTPRHRQALLLTTLEEFSAAEAAQIMETTEEEIGALVEQARVEIGAQKKTDILIIEDEAMIALDLESIVSDMGHRVIGVATTRDQAVALVEQQRPGLVLADIKLGDGSSGIDAVGDILQSFSVPVIFITAYPERLLTGKRPEPTFLISKPFLVDTVRSTISQALFFQQNTNVAKS